MSKLNLHTPNLVDKNIKKIAELFPNTVTEVVRDGKTQLAIDFDILKQELFDVVTEETEERYQFTWPDKGEAMLLANAPIYKTLRPCRDESVDFDTTENLYIEGDNLDALKLLQETYLGKVKMIYIDPPYNTGKDFIYADDFKQSVDEYMDLTDQYDEDGNRMFTNSETNGRYHTDWLNMIYPRLKLAKDLLKDDGVIFISIDDNEVHNLRKVCDEVFGAWNFVTHISILCNPKGRSQDLYTATCHEYILCYSKRMLPKGAISIEKTQEEIAKDYPLHDDSGSYREIELRNTHRDFGKHNRPNLYYPIYVYDNGKISLEPVLNSADIHPIWDDGFNGCWTWSRDKAKKEINLLVAKKINKIWRIYRKSYSHQDGKTVKKQVKSVWLEKSFFTEKGQSVFNLLFQTKDKIFQSPKSIDLVKELLKMAQTDNEIVIDFFSGSATTAHAVMQLNAEDGGKRRFIMVQLPQTIAENHEAYKAGYRTICDIGKERIRRAGQKIKSDQSLKTQDLDIGFRVLKVDSTNMQDVYYYPDQIAQETIAGLIENIKKDRSAEDLLFQVMLELGALLSCEIESELIDGKKVFVVYQDGEVYLIACFDDKVSSDVVTAIAKRQPYYAVFRDNSMADDSLMTSFEQIFETYSKHTVRKVL